MPAVARCGENCIDIRPREELLHVDVLRAVGVAVVLVHDALDRVAALLAHVADGHELDVLLRQHPVAQVAGTAAAEADGAHHDAVGRRHFAVQPERGGGHEPRQRDRAARPAEKRSSRNLHNPSFHFADEER